MCGSNGRAKPMYPRVLMVVPHYPPPVGGGLEGQAHQLARAVSALGARVLVLSARFAEGQQARETHDGVPVLRVPLPARKWLRGPLTAPALAVAMVRHRGEYDIVHAHNLSWFGGFAILVAKALRKPVLVKLPTATEYAFREGSARFRIFEACDAIALLSEDTIADFRRRGFPEGRTFKITNGVALEDFHPGPPRTPAPGAPVEVIFVGRLDPMKGLDDLLEVWPRVLARAGCPARLSICGEGPEDARARRRIAELGIADSVVLRGRVAEVADALRASDVFVLPSEVEGNSNAVLEAMATGLPVLSTRVGGTPLLVGPEGAALLIEPRDRAGLEERLARLVADESLRRAAGAAMLTRARANFSIDAIAALYLRVYEALADGHPDRVGARSSPVFASETPASNSRIDGSSRRDR
jgi:glycosyltransferase involved in cell wall biosynthesis